jgi:hypothetical protein
LGNFLPLRTYSGLADLQFFGRIISCSAVHIKLSQ